ncbi:MAG: capsule assembly Wzi family protein [Bacteroidales bacterium]
MSSLNYCKIVVLLFFSLSQHLNVNAQIALPEIEADITTHTTFGERAPFWMVSNQHGKYSLQKHGALTSIKLYSESDTGKIYNYKYGVELANHFDGNNRLWFHQAYFHFGIFNKVEMRLGAWEETIGNEYTPLSSGSILWSDNARPLPKIEVGTPGFVEVPYTKGYAEVSGSLAHGWFEEGRYVQNVYLHRKYIYGRVGGSLPVNITFGLMHVAQWGGNSPAHGQLPVDWDSYRRVFFADSGGVDAPAGWQINRFGNHIGSRNYGVDVKFKNFEMNLYHQDIFEDGSGKRRENFPDGLWGVHLTNKNREFIITDLVYEYLQTTDQSGPIHDLDSGLKGNDNYFNHDVYQSGWTSRLMTIGTPFVTSPIYTQDIDQDKNFRIWNNRVRVHHFGVQGIILNRITYGMKFSYSQNYGVYLEAPAAFEISDKLIQYSWIGYFNYPIPRRNLIVSGALGLDRGEMYGNNFGVQLKVSYTFSSGYLSK